MTKGVPQAILQALSLCSAGSRYYMGPNDAGEDTWLVFNVADPNEPLLYVGSGPIYNPSIMLPDFSDLTATQQKSLAESIFDDVDCLYQHQGGVLVGIAQSIFVLHSLQNAASTKKALAWEARDNLDKYINSHG